MTNNRNKDIQIFISEQISSSEVFYNCLKMEKLCFFFFFKIKSNFLKHKELLFRDLQWRQCAGPRCLPSHPYSVLYCRELISQVLIIGFQTALGGRWETSEEREGESLSVLPLTLPPSTDCISSMAPAPTRYPQLHHASPLGQPGFLDSDCSISTYCCSMLGW